MAFVTVDQRVGTVDVSTGEAVYVGGHAAALDSYFYAEATAIAPVGAGLCFSALTNTRQLLCAPSATGAVSAAPGDVTIPDTAHWALSASGRVWLPCYTAEGTGPHPCAYAPAAQQWDIARGVTTPYSSFTAVGADVFFAGTSGAGAGMELYTAPAA